MPVDIPGFYYDDEKKKYFKITSNSTGNNQYTRGALKHKRDEEEIKRKISKLRVQQDRVNVPFILSDNVLGIRNRLKFNTFDAECSNIYRYRFQCLQLDGESTPLLTNVHQSPNNRMQIKKIMRHEDDIIVGKDSYIHMYRIKDLENSKGGVHAHFDNYEHLLKHSTLRNLEILKKDLLVRTWCGLMNEPSILQIQQGYDIKYTHQFPNELINSSKCQASNVFSWGDKRIHVTDLNRYDVIDSFHSKGDCLSLSFGSKGIAESPKEAILGYRDSYVRLWDLRSKKFTLNSKLKDLRSVINISRVNQFDVVCSSIGSLNSNNLHMYDLRMGFKSPKVRFQSSKNISNIFDENFQLNDSGEFFMIQNSQLIEVFNISEALPIKTISKFDVANQNGNEIRFEGSFFDDENFELFTTSNSKLMIFK